MVAFIEAESRTANQSNFTLTCPSPMSATQEDHTVNNGTLYTYCLQNFTFDIRVAISIAICVVAVFGLLGNGTVIWLLGFHMKRTHFTTYVLNLAVADLGVFVSSVLIVVAEIVVSDLSLKWPRFLLTSLGLFHLAYNTSQILLTTISIDRCVSLLLPFWYRFHRPERFSAVLCALIWLLSILVHGLCSAIYFNLDLSYSDYHPLFYAYLVTAVVCLPLITVSTLILFVRFCLKSQQRQRGKLLMAILLALFFFLIFAFPLDVIHLIMFNPKSSQEDNFNIFCYGITDYGWLFASLNSFVNPFLYFLVGTKKRGLCGVLKAILQRVFIEEEEEEEEAPREEPDIQ